MEPSRQYICAYKLSLVCASSTSESVAQDPKSFRTPRMCKPCYNLKASQAYNSSTRRTSRLSRNTQRARPNWYLFGLHYSLKHNCWSRLTRAWFLPSRRRTTKSRRSPLSWVLRKPTKPLQLLKHKQQRKQQRNNWRESDFDQKRNIRSAFESVLGQDDLDEVYAEEQEERLTATEAYAQSLRSIGSCLYQNKRLMLSLKNSMCDLQRESQMRRLCSCTCKFHDLESELSTAYDDERAAK